jgi:alpha-mannosidase
VLRIFETANTRATATIKFGLKIKSAKLVNLMEEGDEGKVTVVDNTVVLELRPFQIATLMVETA